MASKYVDLVSIIQVIGSVYKTPQLLDYTDKYIITENDFSDQFHKIIFGAIYKLHELGAERITLENILDFLSTRPKSEAIFKQQKGEEWLARALDSNISTGFDYYYSRMKKMSLLRAYDSYGIDVSFIYDPDNILDTCIDEILQKLLGKGYCVILRPHPQYVRHFESKLIALGEKYADKKDFILQMDFSSNSTVFNADILMTDWSGIGYEYSFTTLKPTLFINTPMKVMNPDYKEIQVVPFDLG